MTITFRDQDLGAAYAHAQKVALSVPVTINGVAGYGLADSNDTIVIVNGGRGEVVGGQHTLVVRTSSFPAIRQDQSVVLDGLNYTVRQKLKEGDDGLTKILLGSV